MSANDNGAYVKLVRWYERRMFWKEVIHIRREQRRFAKQEAKRKCPTCGGVTVRTSSGRRICGHHCPDVTVPDAR